MSGVKKSRGRPSAYRPEYAEQAEKLCLLGATDVELADFFKVSINTIANWQRQHPDFLGAIKDAKKAADSRTERSLFHRANGYTFEGEKVFQFQGKVVRAKTREHVPPDTTACIFWLKNRRPDQWRDKSEHVHRHEGVGGMSDAELEHIAAAGSNGITAPQVDPSKLN